MAMVCSTKKVLAVFMRYIIHFIGDLNTLHGSLPLRLYQHYEGNHHTSSPVRCHLRPHHRYELGHIPVKLKESVYVRVGGQVLAKQGGTIYYPV